MDETGCKDIRHWSTC